MQCKFSCNSACMHVSVIETDSFAGMLLHRLTRVAVWSSKDVEVHVEVVICNHSGSGTSWFCMETWFGQGSRLRRALLGRMVCTTCTPCLICVFAKCALHATCIAMGFLTMGPMVMQHCM